MAVVRITDVTGASYFDLDTGSHLDSRKAEVDNFANLHPKLQAAHMEIWAEESAGNTVTGLNGLAEVSAYLKENKRRAAAGEAAKKQLVVETLSVPLEVAKKIEHKVGASNKQVDLIQAVRDTLGIPYGTLANWAADADADVVAEIQKRADAVEAAKAVKQSPA